MGWASGTEVCIDIWNGIRKHIPEKDRVGVLAKIIKALGNQDWDCECEIEDEWPEAKAALKKALPDYEVEDGE